MTERTVCPSCGDAATPVDRITMKALLNADGLRRGVPAQPRYCGNEPCPVVYFDIDAPTKTFSEADLTVRVYAKHPTDSGTPICYCFGITVGAMRDAGDAHAVRTMIAAEVGAGHCACEVKNPKGGCCLGDVIRLEQGRAEAVAACCDTE